MPFGAIAAGRPVQTNFEQVEPSKWVVTLTQFEKINHLVIFLFGDPLPPGFGASVYLNFSPSSSPSSGPSWQLLGYLSNEKPSAIFKLNPFKKPFSLNSNSNPFRPPATTTGPMSISTSHEDMLLDESLASSNDPTLVSLTATLGISIEPQEVIQHQLASLPSFSSSSASSSQDLTKPGSPPAPSLVSEIALKVLHHLYHFAMSFATTAAPSAPTFASMAPSITSASVIPIKAFEEWWQTVQRKVKMDPQFLMKSHSEG